MERRAFALWCVGVGLLVGIAGNILFYQRFIGLSFLIFIGLAVTAVILSARFAHIGLNRRNLWLIIPMMVFAAMVAVRVNENLLYINIMAAGGLGLLLMHYITSQQALDTDSLQHYVGGAVGAGVRSVTDPIMELADGWLYLRESGLQGRGQILAVVRGLAFTIPVVLVFATLLASADQVFGKYLNEMFSGMSFDGLTSQIILIGSLGWLAIGGLSYALARRTPPSGLRQATEEPLSIEDMPTTVPDSNKRKNTPIILTMIETGMMMISVNLLFIAFVAIQFTYLFGGQSNITSQGFTYSQYARRGFYELLMVTGLVLCMGLFLDWVTVRRGKNEQLLFRGLNVVLSGLTGILIVSASQRMVLYEQVYGFTDDRVLSHVFILWLGVLFIPFLLNVFRLRKNVFPLGLLLVMIGYVLTLNVMNLDAYIAAQNIERYRQGEALDLCYMNTLSADAVPVVAALFKEATPGSDLHTQVGFWLYSKSTSLMWRRQDSSLFSYNAGIESAWAALADIQDELGVVAEQLQYYPHCMEIR